MIEYIARRSLAPGHIAGQTYTLDLEVSEAVPNVADVREDARSAGGAIESVFERTDTYWTIDTAPFSGDRVFQVREFLDSIESGETFRVWLTYGDIVPLVLKQEGGAGSEESFMRTGSAERDFFTARFTALQAAPYDITGLQPGGGDGGFDGGESEPIDVYDPENPEGGMDVPPAVPLESFTFEITCGFSSTTLRGYSSTSYGTLNSNSAADRVSVTIMNTNTIPAPDRLTIRLDNYSSPTFPAPSDPLPYELLSQEMFDHIVVQGMGTFYAADATFTIDLINPDGDWSATWYWTMTSAFPTTGTRQIDVVV